METPEIGEIFLGYLWKHYTEFSPTHVNNFEPVKYAVSSPSEALAYWGSSFLWKNRHKRILGSIWPGAKGKLSWVVIEIQKCKSAEAFLPLFKDIAELLKVEIATMHPIITEEPAVFGSVQYALQYGFAPNDLKKGIPCIPWKTLFSQKYVDKLSIKGSPPSPASCCSFGLLTEVTVSERPDDNQQIIQTSRENIRNWIGSEHFYDCKQ